MEALALARHFDYEIQVIGAHWVDEPNTHVTPWDYFRSLAEAVKVRWYLLTGGYNHAPIEAGEPRPAPVEKL
jgi:hypothetical protein